VRRVQGGSQEPETPKHTGENPQTADPTLLITLILTRPVSDIMDKNAADYTIIGLNKAKPWWTGGMAIDDRIAALFAVNHARPSQRLHKELSPAHCALPPVTKSASWLKGNGPGLLVLGQLHL